VKLTPAQVAVRDEMDARWLESLRVMAADDSDPEMQANARALLLARGLEV
jgi:hypothetical protein